MSSPFEEGKEISHATLICSQEPISPKNDYHKKWFSHFTEVKIFLISVQNTYEKYFLGIILKTVNNLKIICFQYDKGNREIVV